MGPERRQLKRLGRTLVIDNRQFVTPSPDGGKNQIRHVIMCHTHKLGNSTAAIVSCA